MGGRGASGGGTRDEKDATRDGAAGGKAGAWPRAGDKEGWLAPRAPRIAAKPSLFFAGPSDNEPGRGGDSGDCVLGTVSYGGWGARCGELRVGRAAD